MKRVTLRPLAILAAAALFAPALGLISPANAQTFSSSYTSTAPKDCRMIGSPTARRQPTRVCPGKAGLVVVISEDDLRETVSVGRNRAAAAKEPAAQTWFGPFNSTTNTVEWRAADGKPFAIIQRWHIADNDDRGQERTGRSQTDAGGDAAAAGRRSAMSPISTARPTPTPTNSPARRPTNSRVISNAARTK